MASYQVDHCQHQKRQKRRAKPRWLELPNKSDGMEERMEKEGEGGRDKAERRRQSGIDFPDEVLELSRKK